MKKKERMALEAAGFRVGDAEDFLELNEEERRLVELRLAISRAVRAQREDQGLTQAEAAKKLRITQPRVALIESAAPGVSLDAMFLGLFGLGGKMDDLRSLIAAREKGKKGRAGTVTESTDTHRGGTISGRQVPSRRVGGVNRKGKSG